MVRWWLAGFVALAACKTVPVTPASTLAALAASPGAFVSGSPVALSQPLVLNREDFVYDAKLSADGSRAAISRLAGDGFHVATFVNAVKVADPRLNVSEFDVEGLEFSPDGSRIAAVSRDGSLRVLDGREVVATWKGAEPLVSVAWSLDGQRIAVGSDAGLITVLDVATLTWVTDVRAHADEVRGLAFRADGALVSASWDRSLQLHTINDALADEARLHFQRVKELVAVEGIAAEKLPVTVVFDARASMTLVRSDLARALNLEDVAGTATVMTASGPQVAKKKKLPALALRQFVFSEMTVGVCDACLPEGAMVVLGESALGQLTWALDSVTQELVITANAQMKARSMPSLLRSQRFEFPAPINDLSLSRDGEVAGLAFSETKAQRTPDLYQREKRKQLEPAREWDCGARVRVDGGEILERVHGHRGVVSTVAISPDGKTLVTGGWDKRLLLHDKDEFVFGWSVRRVRFSRDGTKLIAAAWTPLNPLGDHRSDPAAVVFDVIYDASATVRPASAAPSAASQPATKAE